MEMLKGNFLINSKGETVIANDVLRNIRYIVLYFSASWCPPCQTFLPLVKKMYEKARNLGISLEIVFVPSDHDNEEMSHFFISKHGPWFALPVGQVPKMMRKKFNIYSIPISDNRVITKHGRKDLENNEDVISKWFPKWNENIDATSQKLV